MAAYKYSQFLRNDLNGAFDQLYHPATAAPLSGIYRCHICGHEAVSTRGHHLPPQDHHVHPQRQPIQWRLAVMSDHA
jgi:hypothetical protein